jgi:4a-hydroxytetrahydrobiopterin dehydratase
MKGRRMARLLNDEELSTELNELRLWVKRDRAIERTVTFGSFTAAINAVDAIALVAEELNHHPDIDIRWRKLHLTLTTHDLGGLSDLDIETARRIDTCVTDQDGKETPS